MCKKLDKKEIDSLKNILYQDYGLKMDDSDIEKLGMSLLNISMVVLKTTIVSSYKKHTDNTIRQNEVVSESSKK